MFNGNKFNKADEYYTDKNAWLNIQQYIPTDKVIWEPFNSTISSFSMDSVNNLRDMGFETIVKPFNPETRENDFFTSNHGDVVVSNPPFSMKKEVLTRLKALDKPFILLLPYTVLVTKYFRLLFKNEKVKIIIPSKRIYYHKMVNGVKEELSRPSFDSLYYLWKIDSLNNMNDIIYLD